MTTILVPLDGSSLAELGLRSASRLAAETGAELLLLRAVLFLSAVHGEERIIEHHEIQDAASYLQEAKERLAAEGVAARTCLLPGDPVRAILFAADAEHVDLISMATHGHGGALDRLLGSVSAAVLRATDRPMLITRADAPPRAAATPLRTILIGLDGGELAESALTYLTRTGLGREARIVLVRTVAPEPVTPAMGIASQELVDRLVADARHVTEGRLEEATAYLEKTAEEKLPGRHTKPIAVGGEPAEVLVDVATGEQADMVVLTTHGRRGMDRLLHGSIAQAVLRRCPTPVLILHGTAAEAPAPEEALATTR